MPIYEYHCEPCDRPFEALIRRADDEKEARCPRCDGREVSRLLSAPASARVGSGSLPVMSGPPAGCSRPGCGPGGCGMG